MPVFKAGKNQAPAWGEVEEFELVEFEESEPHVFIKECVKEELIVCRGIVVVTFGDVKTTLMEGSKLDLNGTSVANYKIQAQGRNALLCRIAGHWRSITSSGIFSAQTAELCKNDTPYSYKKTTAFDNHYHDCDEYWIIFQGEATVASENRLYDVKPGDCVVTGMGWHHDVVCVYGDKPLKAIWFEGGLEGQKRKGHLWETRHGKALPMKDRV